MKTELLIAKLDSAKTAITKAEADLEKAIGEIRVAPRAQKVSIDEVLEDAFARLRTARAELVDIEELIAGGES